MRVLLVVAAALIREDKVLIAQRPEGKQLAGLWEFPGGKLERQETPEAGLARELREELGVEVAVDAFTPLTFASLSNQDKGFHLLMPLFTATEWANEPVAQEGQALRWATAADLDELLAADLLPPADVPLVAHVCRALEC